MSSLVGSVMQGRDWTPTSVVLRLLMDAGSPNRDAARNMLYAHFVRGALERLGTARNFRWRLVDREGTAPAPRPRKLRNRQGASCVEITPPALAYVGPVFDRSASLAPSLGVPVEKLAQCEDEVVPRDTAQLIDNLHRRIFEEQRQVE